MEIIGCRSLWVDAVDERRRRAVKMRLDGVSLKDTAAQCEMSRTTVIAAIKAHAEGGWRAVHHTPRPSRKHGAHTLTAKQEREVQRLSKSTYSARSLRGRTFPSLRGIVMACFGQ